ncbi:MULTISPECIES: efflux RND transporter periplasmic adaptor subunit [unclassified Mesorhizobium]|uniref:efflux RND transporter periplasmic adaptor subunit n=1 Tax=unclassified Mesorhizobium TaxID=325217 RepID=UPI00333933EF
MNMITEHDRKLAAKLAAALAPLPPGPVADTVEPRRKGLRRLILPMGFSVLAVTAIAVVYHQPELYRTIEAKVLTTTGLTDDAVENGVSAPVEQPGALNGAQVTEPIGTQAPIAREINGSGYVIAPRTTTVFSKYEGRITSVAVQVGDLVEAGQVLVTLDDAGAQFALEQAEAAKVAADLSLAARNIDLDQARASLGRTESLAARDAASRQQLDEARWTLERAENTVAQARQELAAAELAIRIAEEPVRELTVRAPFAGTVTRVDAHVGDTMLARVDSVRESLSLLTITDRTKMVIDADVAESSMADLRPGLRGEAVLDGFPDSPFSVEVLRVAPVASMEKGTVTLRLSLTDPPAGMRPNMAARIRIQLTDTVSKTGANSQ